MIMDESPWTSGTTVELRVWQTGVQPRLAGTILGTLVAVNDYGVTITQTIDTNGQQGIVLYPWHRVVDVKLTGKSDD